MGRKSNYVQTVNNKDVAFINSLRCSGVCTKLQAQNFISANRLKNFVLDKTLEKCSHVGKNGKRIEVYRITTYGKRWIEKNMPCFEESKFYSSTGANHDLKIMDKILTLSDEQRSTMRCEAEIRDDFKQRAEEFLQTGQYDVYAKMYSDMEEHKVSMPDLAYGVDEYFEVITSSYGQAEVEAKVQAVSMLNGNLQLERA